MIAPVYILYVSAIILSGFLSFLLFTKKNKSAADYFLIAWLTVTGSQLITTYLFHQNYLHGVTSWITIGFSTPLLQGPFLFIYTRLIIQSGKLKIHHLLHLIPVIISILMFLPFHFLSETEKVEVFTNKGLGFLTQLFINRIMIYVSGITYIFLSVKTVVKYKQREKENGFFKKLNFRWAAYINTWLVAIWVVILFVQHDKIIFSTAALFILWMGYFGIKHAHIFASGGWDPLQAGTEKFKTQERTQITNLFTHEKNDPTPVLTATTQKYQKSSLKNSDIQSIHAQLKQSMETDKVFTDTELSLQSLADKLTVNPHHLSQVINMIEQKTFYDYINHYRISEVILRLKKTDHQHLTLLAIAFSCGFNSKASFNRNFKKMMGITPTEYLKKLDQKEI